MIWLGCDALLSSLDMDRTVKWYCPCPLQTGNFNLGTHGMCPLTTFICITTQPDCLLPPILLSEHFISCTIKNYFTKHAFVFYSCNIGGELALLFFPWQITNCFRLRSLRLRLRNRPLLGRAFYRRRALPFYERWPRLSFHMSPHNRLWQRKTRFFPSFSFYFQLHIYSTHIV